jgi:competence protein ComEA
MPELSRTQLAVYAAVAVALLLVGARALSSGGDREAAFADTPAPSSATSGATDEGGGDTVAIGSGGPDVVVDVTGKVSEPGVYRLPAGSRVDDAIARAGGATAKSSLEAINLAARLGDGQQVLVPGSIPGGAAAAAAGVVSEDGPISLGSASVEQLETIDGIGPVTAADIAEFRDEHGGLSSVDQLDQVPGIGPATMEALRDRLQP